MGGMAGVGVAPPPNHPPTSLAGGSTRARHPGPSIARARCGGKRYPGCLSVPLPPKSPDPPPPTIPSKPPRPSSPGTTMLGKAHSRARAAAAAALARLIARAVCGGYGGGGGRLHRPSRALRAPRVTRVYAYVVTAHRARHRRFRSPRAGPARARCCGGGACSLVRAEAVGLGVAFSYTARHARHARARARHHRASHASSPFLFPHAPTHVRCDGGGARSLDSARGVWRLRWRWRAVEGAGGYIARHARYARRASRACARTSSPRIARVITVFRPPRARPARRARCCGGGARSLARARGGGGGGVGGGVQLHRASRASRARA